MRRALYIALKEWRFLARYRIIALVVVLPVIFCFAWGYCASLDLQGARLAVLDQAGDAGSRALARELGAQGVFRLQPAASWANLEGSLRSGGSDMALIIPPDAARAGLRRHGGVQVIADATDPNLAGTGIYDLTRGALRFRPPGLDRGPRREPAPAIATNLRIWYNPALDSHYYLLLNAVAYSLMAFLMYPAESLILERLQGSFQALAASPITAGQLWLGTVLPHGLVALWGGLIQVAVILFGFGVPLRGEGWLLLAGMALFLLVHLNLGCLMPLVINRVEHSTVLALGYMFVSMAFSGFFLPLSSLPDWARQVAAFVPLKHELSLLQGVFLRGSDGAALQPELAFLAGTAAATSLLAVLGLRLLLQTRGGGEPA